MDIEAFLNRFNRFYDSVIRNVNIDFGSPGNPRAIKVEISAKDGEEWTNVLLVIGGVSSFRFTENSKASYQVISDGLNILEKNGVICIDFGYFDKCPSELEQFFESPSHVVGKQVNWSVTTSGE